ncbi:MAG TPA: tyrosine-type recombinase/integrase [Sedimentisphaerales bacterium]|nr:tyrosine-type recombinase/integrase [Sedimentisphaerales bacterium]
MAGVLAPAAATTATPDLNLDDAETDGWTICEGDCGDNYASVNPGEAEISNNPIDDDCDGLADCNDHDCNSALECADCLSADSIECGETLFGDTNAPGSTDNIDLYSCAPLLEDESARYFDFHALRGECSTLLAASGVHPEVAQTIMRHNDINLTMNAYTHTLRGQEAKAIESLLDLSLPSRDKQQARAPGKEGALAENLALLGGNSCTTMDNNGQPTPP